MLEDSLVVSVEVWSETRSRHKNTSWDVFKDKNNKKLRMLAKTEHHLLTTIDLLELVTVCNSREFGVWVVDQHFVVKLVAVSHSHLPSKPP